MENYLKTTTIIFILVTVLFSGCSEEEAATPPVEPSQKIEDAFQAAYESRDWKLVNTIGQELQKEWPYTESAINFESLKIHLKHRLNESPDLKNPIFELAEPKDFLQMTDEQLKELIANCRAKIDADLQASNNTPFQWMVLDEYAADAFISAAGNSSLFESTEKRISELHRMQAQLNLSFPTLRITDSFSGPQKEVKAKSCMATTDRELM